MHIELTKSFSLAIAIYSPYKYDPRRDVLSWSPPMNLFLHHDISRIPTAYTQAFFAVIEIQNHQKSWNWFKMDKIITNTFSTGMIIFTTKITFLKCLILTCFLSWKFENVNLDRTV